MGMSPTDFPCVVRAKRPGTSLVKFALCAELHELAHKVPAEVNSGGVETTRRWLSASKKAQRHVMRADATVQSLKAQLASMKSWNELSA